MVVTRGLDVTGFARVAGEDFVSAVALADRSSDTDGGQETTAKMIAGMDEEMRVGGDVQPRGETAPLTTNPTTHCVLGLADAVQSTRRKTAALARSNGSSRASETNRLLAFS